MKAEMKLILKKGDDEKDKAKVRKENGKGEGESIIEKHMKKTIKVKERNPKKMLKKGQKRKEK